MKSALSAVAGLQLLCTVVVCPLFGPCRGGHVEPDYTARDTGVMTDTTDAGDLGDIGDATDANKAADAGDDTAGVRDTDDSGE